MYYRSLNEKHTVLWSGISSEPDMMLVSEMKGKKHSIAFHTAYCFAPSFQLLYCCQVIPMFVLTLTGTRASKATIASFYSIKSDSCLTPKPKL